MAVLYERLSDGKPWAKIELYKSLPVTDGDNRLYYLKRHGAYTRKPHQHHGWNIAEDPKRGTVRMKRLP